MILTFLFYLILFIIILVPLLLAVLLMYFSKVYNFTYQTYGYLKYKNILLKYEDNKIKIEAEIGDFQIYLIWLRIRFKIRNINVSIKLKNKKVCKDYFEGVKRNSANNAENLDDSELRKY